MYNVDGRQSATTTPSQCPRPGKIEEDCRIPGSDEGMHYSGGGGGGGRDKTCAIS